MKGNGVTVTVELDLEAEPVAGTLIEGDRRHEFTGWVALVGLIESLRTGSGRAPTNIRGGRS